MMVAWPSGCRALTGPTVERLALVGSGELPVIGAPVFGFPPRSSAPPVTAAFNCVTVTALASKRSMSYTVALNGVQRAVSCHCRVVAAVGFHRLPVWVWATVPVWVRGGCRRRRRRRCRRRRGRGAWASA
jgi:hypothetical protein